MYLVVKGRGSDSPSVRQESEGGAQAWLRPMTPRQCMDSCSLNVCLVADIIITASLNREENEEEAEETEQKQKQEHVRVRVRVSE